MWTNIEWLHKKTVGKNFSGTCIHNLLVKIMKKFNFEVYLLPLLCHVPKPLWIIKCHNIYSTNLINKFKNIISSDSNFLKVIKLLYSSQEQNYSHHPIFQQRRWSHFSQVTDPQYIYWRLDCYALVSDPPPLCQPTPRTAQQTLLAFDH